MGLFGAADFALRRDAPGFGFSIGTTAGTSSPAETVTRLIEGPGRGLGAPFKLFALLVVTAAALAALAYVEWMARPDGVGPLHGYTVIDTSHGVSAVAELAAPSARFDELFAVAEPFLLTLRFAG